MVALIRAMGALPWDRLARHPEVILAALVASTVAMMIHPPPWILIDALLAVNVAVSFLVLVSALLSERALAISSFPSLLLLATLFRLALNVSTTRLILTTGDGGDVVRAFGELALGGDVVVGLVVFLVIALVQLIVIAKGAERVAEVGARFTLDALPGRQMSIDAALRAGTLDEDDAEKQRDELQRESQFYGAMDGAMKFVKGDAIAGLAITAINLIAGLLIGVFRFDLSWGDAVLHYSVLTVGDGLVAAVPALLITLSAGVLVTRVGAKRGGASLAARVGSEILASEKVLGIGAAFSALLALVPGLPCLPFLGVGILLGAASYRRLRETERRNVEARRSTEAREAALKRKLEERVRRAKAQRALADNIVPAVAPIGIDLDPSSSDALGFGPGPEDDTELLGVLIPELRDALYLETGVRYPCVRVRARVAGLPEGAFVIRVKDVPVVMETLKPDYVMAIESPERLSRIGASPLSARHPLSGREVALVPKAFRGVLEASGVSVWSPAGVVVLHLARVLKGRARDFVGLQETSELVERLEKVYPALVKEVVPRIVSVGQLTDVLRRLADEGVSIRDLKTILEGLAEFGAHQSEGVVLTELVRRALAPQIGHAHAGLSGRLCAVLLDAVIEDTIRGAIGCAPSGVCLALEPDIRRAIIESIEVVLRPAHRQGARPVILTDADIRRHVRKLIEDDLPEVSVLSYQELPGDLTVQPLGRASVRDGEVACAA